MEGLKSRAVALVVCIALIFVGWFGGNAIQNMGDELITAQAAGVKSNAVVMKAGDQEITAAQYLYWLTSTCDELYYYGASDMSIAVAEGMTAGDYAKKQADNYAAQYAAVKLLAEEQGITLTESQKAQLNETAEYFKQYYGSEEIYNYMLLYCGLNEDLLALNSEVPFLYANLCDKLLGEGGALEPTEENLQAFAERHQYTDLNDETLLVYYQDTEYGAAYDYVSDTINNLEMEKTETYDAIDVAAFYSALQTAREALPKPDVSSGSAED